MALINTRGGEVIMLFAAVITGKLFFTLTVILVTFMICSTFAGLKLRDYKGWIQNLFIGLLIVDILLFVTTIILLIWSI